MLNRRVEQSLVITVALSISLLACDRAEAPVATTTTEAPAPMVAPGTTATASDGTVVNVAPDTGTSATPADMDVTVGTPATTTTTTTENYDGSKEFSGGRGWDSARPTEDPLGGDSGGSTSGGSETGDPRR